jgi:AraC family transcriptional regulator
MIPFRIVELPAFEIAGKKTWIAGVDDNAAFGRFWEQCRADGLFSTFESLTGLQSGPLNNGAMLGFSRVDQDPAKREFYYMVAVEIHQAPRPPGWNATRCRLPCGLPLNAGTVTRCDRPSEIYAFPNGCPPVYRRSCSRDGGLPPGTGPGDANL